MTARGRLRFPKGPGPASLRSGPASIPAPLALFVALLPAMAPATGPGALFTTTPDGADINENHYGSRLEAYVNGGPAPSALEGGDWVFQVTDPAGDFLLSSDPAACRVFRVEDGAIVARRDGTPDGLVDHLGDDACHVDDLPEGEAGSSGRHDTNLNVSHGAPEVVIQLAPFLLTPNPAGVCKAWILPLDRYLNNGGRLESEPRALCGAPEAPRPCEPGERPIGYAPDPGFGPPHRDVKTDAFQGERGDREPPAGRRRRSRSDRFVGETVKLGSSLATFERPGGRNRETGRLCSAGGKTSDFHRRKPVSMWALVSPRRLP